MHSEDSFHECNTGKREEQISKDHLFVDCHVDLPYYMMHHTRESKISELNDAPFTLEKARQSGVRLFCTAIYCDDKYNGEGSLENFNKIYEFIGKSFDAIEILRNKSQMHELKRSQEGVATILLLENADFLADAPLYLEELPRMGIRIAGLTHAGKNRLADGNSVVYPDGITKKGKEIITRLKDEKIVIDVSHLHEKCFWQLMRMVEDTIISSHTGIREIYNIQRDNVFTI